MKSEHEMCLRAQPAAPRRSPIESFVSLGPCCAERDCGFTASVEKGIDKFIRNRWLWAKYATGLLILDPLTVLVSQRFEVAFLWEFTL